MLAEQVIGTPAGQLNNDGRPDCQCPMETTEKIVESYCRYVKQWFTIPNIRCAGLYSGKYDRAILEGIERSLQAASELVLVDGCWIEHVLPKSVADDADGVAWKAALGADWDKVRAEWLHTPGNLT